MPPISQHFSGIRGILVSTWSWFSLENTTEDGSGASHDFFTVCSVLLRFVMVFYVFRFGRFVPFSASSVLCRHLLSNQSVGTTPRESKYCATTPQNTHMAKQQQRNNIVIIKKDSPWSMTSLLRARDSLKIKEECRLFGDTVKKMHSP